MRLPNRIRGVGFSLPFLFLAPQTQAQTPTPAQNHYLEARKLIAHPAETQDWPQAANECRAALRDQPDYPEALNLLGIALTAMNQPDQAVPVLKQALTLRPHYPEGHLSLGLAYRTQSKNAAALDEYRRAITERPGYTAAHVELAKILFTQNESAAARNELETAFQQDPDLPEIHYLFSRLDLQANDHDAANIELRQVQELNNRRAQAAEATRLSNAGLDAAKQGDFARAVASLRAAVSAKPDDALAHYNLGLILADTGHLSEGIAELRTAISLDPAEISKMRASLQRMLDRVNVDRAAQQAVPETKPDTLASIGGFLHTLSIDPANFDARYNLALAWLRIGKYDESTLEFYKLIKLRPHSAAAHFGLGLALRQSGDRPAAAREFSAALEAQPNYPNARYYLEISQSKPQ